MKLKLSYKIFVAFTLTSIMVVALMVGLMRFYVARNFAEYVNQSMLKRYTELADALTSEYRKHQGWHTLDNNHKRWEEILQSNLPAKKFDKRKGFPPPPEPEISGPEHIGQRIPPSRPPKFVSRRIVRKLALFDAAKQHIAGGRPNVSYKSFSLQKIEVDGRTVGWLGLHRREPLDNPLAAGFLKQQSQLFYIIGGVILLLAGIAAFLLSRHLLAPVRKLAEGTRTLASRRFDTRIDVESKDELGQLATDFNIMAQTLERYESMRQQWIFDIAHELRTPLSILRGEIEALKDGIREINRDALDSLHSEARHLSKIVNDLHELSMADAGELSIRKDLVDPVAILEETIGYFKLRFADHQITVEKNLENQSQTTIIGDRDRLQQLFSNLLENTLCYANSHGTLKIGQELTENGLILFFEDSGPGVPDEALDRLFDRLYRVDKSRSRNQGGSGLGLSICKSIVSALGGEIRAANGISGGLRIEVELPLAGKKDKTHD